jgi:hypothetical protein
MQVCGLVDLYVENIIFGRNCCKASQFTMTKLFELLFA